MTKPEEHGPLYWLFHNTTRGVREYFKRNWWSASMTAIVLLGVLFMTRAVYQPYLVALRRMSFLLVPVILLAVTWFWARRRTKGVKILVSAVCLVGFAVLLVWGKSAHEFVSLYYRYQTLNIVELDKLPVTGHERMQPLNSIYSLAHEKAASEMESPQRPDFVRINDEYRWTLAIEPAHLLPRMGRVKQLVSTEDAKPDFGNREAVDFEVGEGMFLGRNSRTATIKSLSLWRFFNYEPSEVKYIKDNEGKWVQVVTLIRWTGIFFPRPEFGGVQLIRQAGPSSGGLSLTLFGTGEWIRPEDVPKHSYLVGQNIVPYDVSRYMANSFRFQDGFFGPMPWSHQGDVRTPNLPADVNDQPFTTYFEEVSDRPGTLYHYFALEPYDIQKQGLSVSLIVPADGFGSQVYAYRHFLHGESLTGVSAVAAKVMDSQKQYDWSRHRPVEHRPFIRDIDGVRKFFWLTTVVTYKDGTTAPAEGVEAVAESGPPQWFIAGALPNIVITGASDNLPVWVSFDPSNWIEEIKTEQRKHGRK